MPVTYHIEDDVVRLVLAGLYGSEEVARTFLAVIADPACPPHFHFLIDVSASRSLSTRPVEELRRTVEFLVPYLDRIGRRAAVVVGSKVDFGMSRMGSAFGDGIGLESRVCLSQEEALDWLRAERKVES